MIPLLMDIDCLIMTNGLCWLVVEIKITPPGRILLLLKKFLNTQNLMIR